MPSSARPTRRASCNYRGSGRWTSNTSDSTSFSTGPAHHSNSNRQIGCIVACASVLPSENSHEIRASGFCLQATTSSRTKTGHVASAAPSLPSAPTSGTRLEIFTGGSAKSPLTPRPRQPTSYAFWTTLDKSSSSSLLLGTLRLLERSGIRGAFKLVKVEPFSMEFCATSMSPAESNLPTPPRQTDLAGGSGWFRLLAFSSFSSSQLLQWSQYCLSLIHI